MKTCMDYYNKTAIQWSRKWYEDGSMYPYLERFMSYLPSNPKVLDLCCGCGYESMRVKKLGAKVTGIDFSEKSIQIAKEINPDITFYVDNILNNYSYVGKFDGCMVIAGLIHISNEYLKTAFDMISNVLYDLGTLFIVIKEDTGKGQKSHIILDNEEYDIQYYLHTLDDLIKYSKKSFSYTEEIILENNTDWKYYIFSKIAE